MILSLSLLLQSSWVIGDLFQVIVQWTNCKARAGTVLRVSALTFIPCMLRCALYGVHGSRPDFAKIFPLSALITCTIGFRNWRKIKLDECKNTSIGKDQRKFQTYFWVSHHSKDNWIINLPRWIFQITFRKSYLLFWDSFPQSPLYLFRGCHCVGVLHQLAGTRLSIQPIFNCTKVEITENNKLTSSVDVIANSEIWNYQ